MKMRLQLASYSSRICSIIITSLDLVNTNERCNFTAITSTKQLIRHYVKFVARMNTLEFSWIRHNSSAI